MVSRLPSSSRSTFALVQEIIRMGAVDIPSQFNGAGAPGNTLEYLLNVKQNNFDTPDFKDWEVKFHGGGGTLLTLFHKEPQPRGIMDDVVDRFGWQSGSHISFRHTLSGSSERGFVVNNIDNKITVNNSNDSSIVPYWEHNTILNSIGAKLRRLILVHGKVNKATRQVIYNNAIGFWDLNLMGICNAITEGIIYIDFDARTTAGRGTSLRNHGTKFRININDIDHLYENSQVIV